MKKSSGESLTDLCHREFPWLTPNDTVEDALAKFRREGLGRRVLYFYVVDEQDRLQGVVPTRVLLTSPPSSRMSEILLKKVVTLPRNASLQEARQAFSRHRFLALPVVDDENRILGILGIEKFAGNLGAVNERTDFDDVYTLLGLQELASSSPLQNFRARFPWLLITVLSGTLAALLTSHFETTLRQALIFAFFLTLNLGLNEAVAMQSATVAIQWFHEYVPDMASYLRVLRKEMVTGFLLSAACGLSVGVIAYLWRGDVIAAGAIGFSLLFSVLASAFWGLTMPFVSRRFQADARVAAAPLALALSDLTALAIYLGMGRKILGV